MLPAAISLAYQVFGDGPVELVFAGPMVSHVERIRTVPEFKAFFDQIATFCRIVLFDKGSGWDPVPKFARWMIERPSMKAVMDAAGLVKAVVFGISDGGI